MPNNETYIENQNVENVKNIKIKFEQCRPIIMVEIKKITNIDQGLKILLEAQQTHTIVSVTYVIPLLATNLASRWHHLHISYKSIH